MPRPVGREERRSGGERKPREERWAQLVEVATQVFFEKGYDGASLQEIADRLGMLKGSLYYYIHSKEDLLYDVISEVHKAGLSNITSLAEQPGDALERLHNVIVGHVEHECRHLLGTSVFLHELQALPAEKQLAIIGDEGAYRGVFRQLLTEGKREGLVRSGLDAKLGALSILGSLNWVYRWFKPGGEYSPREIGEEFADMIVRSVASESGLAGWQKGAAPAKAQPERSAKRAPRKASNASRRPRAAGNKTA